MEPVRPREKQTSIAVSKNFPGSSSLSTVKDVQVWLEGLVRELVKRLVEDQIKVWFLLFFLKLAFYAVSFFKNFNEGGQAIVHL